jgi:methylthioribose-1-phosphate isomerase
MRTLAALERAVAWDGRLSVIDQTRLPGRLERRILGSVDEVVDAITRLVVRGAPALGVCGAYGVVVGLDEARPADADAARAALRAIAARIGSARPTAVNLRWAVERVAAAAAQGANPAEMRARALAEAERVRAEDERACERIGAYGRAELAGAARILTHCNTGRLATAGIGTALGVVYAKAAAGEPVEVLACETRPLLQGARLTAWELVDAGIAATLLADGAAAAAMAEGRVDAVVVGCDRVARNGDTANKVGTYAHALAARHHGIPFYVAGPLSSFDPACASGRDIAIEQRPAGEVLPAGAAGLAGSLTVLNPAFDVAPAALVTAFLTDAGVVRPPFEAGIADARRGAETGGAG